MRKCCCCISVHAGSIVLGLAAVALSLLELVVLIPYYIGVEEFNPIQENAESFYYLIEDLMKDRDVDEELQATIMKYVREYTYWTLLGEGICVLFYMVFAVLMIAGVKSRKRGLMLPYMIYQMLVLIVFLLVGIAATVGLFFVNYIMGAISCAIFLIAASLFIYFWATVQRAYKEIGNRDYMYAPAPVKPIYNPPMDSSRYPDHPTAPQQFHMD